MVVAFMCMFRLVSDITHLFAVSEMRLPAVTVTACKRIMPGLWYIFYQMGAIPIAVGTDSANHVLRINLKHLAQAHFILA